MTEPFAVVAVRSAADLAAVARLFESYAAALDVDLAYQGFDAELAGLPGAYAPPGGELLLARNARGEALGCVALRPLAPGVCEMKRLYVAPGGRGTGLGRALVQAMVRAAATLSYRELRLDTLPTMAEAIALYRTMGFVPTAPYYDTAPDGTIFLARALSTARSAGP
ncbi:GNAT family N-acetyltransferase [Phenylobacterium sp.]|uniref:GNAT family N-acetyltransferase n=1 Tax=Phenylobacterium sp. TaxID=1871053 RepID=UPI0025E582A2|nr:GNAT family N-acetyltransferase [Phenylobacterium sp.]